VGAAPGPAAAAAGHLPRLTEPQHAPVIIAGFGRYGQIVGRLLSANGHSATVLDHSVENVEGMRRFGWPAFYGDATRLDLLRVAGADRPAPSCWPSTTWSRAWRARAWCASTFPTCPSWPARATSRTTTGCCSWA
jgi:hypothetical protein